MHAVPSDLTELPAFAAGSRLVHVVIDTPRHSRCKYKYEPALGAFVVKKLLPVGAVFPHAFGFVPSTRGGDGDPLDVLVVCEEPLIVGCVATVRIAAVMLAEQREHAARAPRRNDRFVASLATAHDPPALHRLADLSHHERAEIERFFVSYNEAEGKRFEVLGWAGARRAHALLRAGRVRV
ncbi:MAG: inorganic diphosphatase [Deltaproteobacteria bacterium]|jgi:inorganic pyrophosphatase|nr:inorganic diphosphatase [Deltaproteobacteria bacterium]